MPVLSVRPCVELNLKTQKGRGGHQYLQADFDRQPLAQFKWKNCMFCECGCGLLYAKDGDLGGVGGDVSADVGVEYWV